MNTKKIIFSAFHELLEKNSINSISVAAILEAAEVSKPTFYRYFYNKYDLLEQWLASMLSPLIHVGEEYSWRQAMEDTFQALEKEYAVFHRGFRTAEEYTLRDSVMIRLIEHAIFQMLEGKGADIHNLHITFSVRSCTITHVAAICGWAGDRNHRPASETVDLILGTVPENLARYFTESDK